VEIDCSFSEIKKNMKKQGKRGVILKSAALALAALLLTPAARAQQSPMPDDIAWALVEIGRTVDPAKTAALYAPLQPKEPYAGVKVERDISYGPAGLNKLDVFTPEGGASARPVLIFVRGGAFVAGDKRVPNTPFYDNIMLWAVKSGFVGVNINYRLAPQSPWPAGVEDVASAVKWVSDNIASRGGDPARVFLMGHSAGAVHVASYVSHPEFDKVSGGGVKGAIMVSGLYDLTADPVGGPEQSYFGKDASRYAERSALAGLLATKTPFMIVTAELDPEVFGRQFDLLKNATCKSAQGCARALLLPQHSHMSEVYSINTADDRLTGQILDFIGGIK
jgi:triacylglycerol lipase